MVTVEVINDAGDFDNPLDESDLASFASKLLAERDRKIGEINIVFIDDVRMIELNENYKKGEGLTDVLTFILSDDPAEFLDGEIYVSPLKAEQQATEYRVQLQEELLRLVVHGLLHISGMTHNTDEDYRDMMNVTDTLVSAYFGKGA